MRQLQSLLIAMSFLSGLVACSTPSSRERMEAVTEKSRPSADVWGAEGFYLHHRSPPDRQVRKWEFYYKNCEFVRHRPYPLQSEYDCSSPY